jgi:hypothetical protein
MDRHYEPAVAEFAERFQFYFAQKHEGETVIEWAARVRNLAKNCKFGVTLDIMMRDKFIMGLPKGPAKDKLFLENSDTLTLQEAIRICLSVVCVKEQYIVKEDPSSIYNLRSKGRDQRNGRQQLDRHQIERQQINGHQSGRRSC